MKHYNTNKAEVRRKRMETKKPKSHDANDTPIKIDANRAT